MDAEEARSYYRPETIRLLFVGESAPAGGTFFYFGNSGFTRYTRRSFEEGLGLQFESNTAFLEAFRDSGCWLDDISLEPVNHLSRSERKALLWDQTPGFRERLAAACPDYLVVSLKSIVPFVEEALSQVSRPPKVHYLPFPGNGHQREYMDQLAEILQQAKAEGILHI